MTGPGPHPDPRPVALVADDAHDSRTLLASMLRHAGLLVVEARDGAQAQALFQEARPVLTFLDIDMPGIDGFTALAAIRALDPKATVVIVSATSSLANVQQTMRLGALGFVVKPYSAKRIIEILRQAAASTGDRRLMPE